MPDQIKILKYKSWIQRYMIMVRFSRGLSKMTLLNRYDIIDIIYSIATSDSISILNPSDSISILCLNPYLFSVWLNIYSLSDSISNKGLRCQDEFILIFALVGCTTLHQRYSFIFSLCCKHMKAKIL